MRVDGIALILRRMLRGQRGSQSLEAAGAALAAALIVMALLRGADVLGAAVEQGLACAASVLVGGGGNCAGGAVDGTGGGGGAAGAPTNGQAAQAASDPLMSMLSALNPFGAPAQAATAPGQTANGQATTGQNGQPQQVAQTTGNASGSNAILNDLQTTGAQATASQDNLGFTGVEASRRMAQTDQARVEQYADIFREVGEKYGIPPAVLAGIASRETRGRAVDSNNSAGAWGMMQILGGSDCNCAADSREHIDQAGQHLRSMLDQVKRDHPDWTEAQQLRGAIAAYNFGADDVRTLERLDQGTDGNDYSGDIWARAQYYAQQPAFGGGSNSTNGGTTTRSGGQPSGNAPVFNGQYTPAPSLADVEAGRAELRPGMEGPAVQELQRLVGADPDGRYGPETYEAVQNFQRANSLQPQSPGAVGRSTLSQLREGGNLGVGVDLSAGGTAVQTRVPASGPGFRHCQTCTSNGASAGYARQSTVRAIQDLGRTWSQRYPNAAPIDFGDLSLQGGGDIPGHSGHETGREVDFYLWRTDGRDLPTTWRDPQYSRQQTLNFLRMVRAKYPNATILYNDPEAIREGLSQEYSGHDNHIHVTFK